MKQSSKSSVHQLNCALIIAVCVTCTLVTLAGWKKIGTLNVNVHTQLPAVRGPSNNPFMLASRVPTNHSGSQLEAASRTAALLRPSEHPKTPAVMLATPPLPPAEHLQCSRSSTRVSLGGRLLDRCSALEAAKMAQDEDIYVSVKTTPKYHSPRMLPILQTWFQTLPANQIHVVTDAGSEGDLFYQTAIQTGIDVISTDCLSAHTRIGLCCKTRNEIMHYFSSTTATGDIHRWYCHFDDDMYVNIPALVKALREAFNKSEDGGVYLGRWPIDIIRNWRNGRYVSPRTLRKLGFTLEKELHVKWAAGAAYCISSTIMRKMRDILSRNTYEQYCGNFSANDDVTVALIVGIAGYALTDNVGIKTQYDQRRRVHIPEPEFPNMVTISHNMYTGPSTKRFSIEADRTRFLSYHCLLYPSTTWCLD